MNLAFWSNKTDIILLFWMASLFVLTNCKDSPKKESLKVTHAEEFNKLVIVDSLGVTGSDGVISFSLSNGKSVFMMGDSFFKPVINGVRDYNSKMINNAFIIVDKKNHISKSIFKGTFNNPKTLLTPKNKDSIKEYYWPGHGFEFNNEIHVFMSRFTHDTDDTWGFTYTGTDYLKLEKSSYNIIFQEDVPFSMINDVHYGHSMINKNDYTYIYGSKVIGNQANLHVARATINKENTLYNYEFFDGNNWVDNPKASQALKGINKDVPEQFSVFMHNEKYILLIQERDLASGNIYSYISDSPNGPWTNEKHLYHTTDQEQYKESKVFTYNAVAHPQFIKDDKLLVSYCINSFNVPEIHENAAFYRPKFIWVPLNMILN